MKSEIPKTFRRSVIPALVIICTTILVGVFLVTRDVGNTFLHDDWMFIATRQNFSLRSLFKSHNGHFSLIPVFIHVLLYKTVGLAQYHVFNLLAPIWHLATALSVGEMVRRRHGLVPAFLGALLVAVSGVGAENYLWSFQIGFMGALLFFVLAVMSFDNAVQNNQLRWRFATLIAISLSLASSGAGIATLGAMFLLVLSTREWRLWWWVVSIPMVIFAGWFARYGELTGGLRPSITQFLDYIFQGLAGTLSGMAGVGLGWGKIALGLIAVLVLIDFQRHRFSVRRSIWLIYLLGFWCMTAFQRAGRYGLFSPLAGRYLWVGTFMFLMIISEVVPKKELRPSSSKLFIIVGIVLVTAASWESQPLRKDYQNFRRAVATQSMVVHSLALSNRANIDPKTFIHVAGWINLDTAADFFQAVDKFGNPSQLSKQTIIETNSLHGSADKAMSDLGLLEIKSVSESCKNIGIRTKVISVNQGQAQKFLVPDKQTVSITRFLEPAEAGDSNKQEISPGVHTVSLASDGFDRPLTLSFDHEIATCD